jgi:hypothetical protein
LALSIVITYCHQLVAGDYYWATFILSTFNALISAGTAIGLYEGAVKPAGRALKGRK